MLHENHLVETVLRQVLSHRRPPSSECLFESVLRNSPGMSMYIKVKILIGVNGISPQEVSAPVGIGYKGRRPQPSRRKFREKSWEYSNRDICDPLQQNQWEVQFRLLELGPAICEMVLIWPISDFEIKYEIKMVTFGS